MARKITFGEVHRLLEGCGFVRVPAKKAVLFEHEPSGALVIFRRHRASEKIDPTTLATVQTTLDMNGFIEREDFEEELQKASARLPKRKKSG